MNLSAFSVILPNKRNSFPRGFSLVEVVVAVGIFAIAVVSVIGLLGPINQSVAAVSESDDATRIVAAVQRELQRLGPQYMFTATDKKTLTLYANRTGDKILLANDPKWGKDRAGNSLTLTNDELDRQKFFEVNVTQNELSEFYTKDSAFYAMNIEVRWPGYLTYNTPTSSLPEAKAQQSVLIYPLAITR
jgi:prepilin-type N-terminal cleavage/methylation domain-containing protein